MQAQDELGDALAALGSSIGMVPLNNDQQMGSQKPAQVKEGRGDGPKAVKRPRGGGPGEAAAGDAKEAEQQEGHRKTSPAMRSAAKARAVGKALKHHGLLPKEKRCYGGEVRVERGKPFQLFTVPSDGDTCSCGGSCKQFREEHSFPLDLPVLDFASSSGYLPSNKAVTLLEWAQTNLTHEAARAELLNELASLDSKYAAEDAAHENRMQTKVSSPCPKCCPQVLPLI